MFSFRKILKLEKFTSNCIRNVDEMNLTIYLEEEYHQHLTDLPKGYNLKKLSEYGKN